MIGKKPLAAYLQTRPGRVYLGDSLNVMKLRKTESVDLFMTSAPFALTRDKDYGNEQENDYFE